MIKSIKLISVVVVLILSLFVGLEAYDYLIMDNASSSIETTEMTETTETTESSTYAFRNQDLFTEHFNKHGHEFGDISQAEYLKIANRLFASQDALRKTESDGDLLFYEAASNTFGVLSKDGYIRTCFKPDDGIAYWNRQ